MKRKINYKQMAINWTKMVLVVVLSVVAFNLIIDGADREWQFRQDRIQEFRAGSK